MDDHLVTNHNPMIEKGIGNLYEIFTTNYISESGVYLDYRPLVKASYALEYSLFGWNPHVSHFINVLLYAIACCLILKVLLLLFGEAYFSVLLTGLILFALHPMHTEVVASLKNRDEIFVLIFIFLSALFLLKYAETSNKKHFVIGFLFFLLSLFSKITGIPFIVIIPLMLYVKHRDLKLPAVVGGTLAVTTVVYYLLLLKLLPGLARPYEYVETPLPYINDWSIKLGTALYSLIYYIKLLVLPIQFSFYYGINYIELKPLSSALPLVSLVFYTSLLGAAVYLFRKNVFLSFNIFFFLFQISLSSNIIQPLPGIVGERVLFTASLGFCLLLAYGIHRLMVTAIAQPVRDKKETALAHDYRITKLQAALLLVIVLFYTGETLARNGDWKDTITLIEADMPHLQKSAKANYMAAKEVRRLYRTDKMLTAEKLNAESDRALKYYEDAVAAYPAYGQALEEMGMIYAIERKDNEKAAPFFKKAFESDSTLWRSAVNMAMSGQLKKDTAAAIAWYERSLKAKPGNVKVFEELGKLYYLKGDKVKALSFNDSIMKEAPDTYLPYYNYAIYYMLEGDTAKAVQYFEEDVKRGEKERFPYQFLFKHYLVHGDTGNALRIRNLVPRVSQ